VSTSGPSLTVPELTNVANWRLAVVAGADRRDLTLTGAAWDRSTKQVALRFSRDSLQTIKLTMASWEALFIGGGRQLTATSPEPKAGGAFTAAKGKDDASLYLFGSFLAGRYTKPIYVIDAKVDYKNELRKSGWFWHGSAAASTNTDAVAPVDKVRIDPDSISTSFVLSKTYNTDAPGIYALELALSPVTGEFTRETGVANVVATGQLTVLFTPVRQMFAFYPSIGYDVGHVIVKPDTIADQAVDFAGWNTISRGVAGATAELYVFKPDPTDTDWYYFTIDASYTARVPFAAEPFVEPGTVNGQRVAVTSVRRNVRHEIEVAANWNLGRYAGVQVQYKYGTLPPLFQLVDHQVTVGITLKAAQTK
jgi:hypothetical protein